MKLKRIIFFLFIAMSASVITPAFAADGDQKANTEKTEKDANAQQLMNRLQEIRNMDRSNLTSTEKKELRKELKEMKKEARKADRDRRGGIYLSVGAIIIIILLLILLL